MNSAEMMKVKLIEIIEPFLKKMGFELVDLNYLPGSSGKLQLFIDREGGITIDHCELVSREVSDFLDYQDPINHSYTLEVSSPGLERPLRKREHFDRYVGEKVKIRTAEPVDGKYKFSGFLQETEGNNVIVRVENGTIFKIPFPAIRKANLWFTEAEKNEILNNRKKGGKR
ncbi:MAG: ribosome maturation factor RimP [Bacillota bacterium]|nr:ribosome maturation factor RimP [Bacillota bacterium]